MAKRTNIRRRGNSWVVVFRANGRQHWRSFKTRDEAELYLAHAQAKKVRGEFRTPTKITFTAFAAEWLRDYALGHVGPKTYEGYEGVLRLHLVPEFGDLFLSEITRKTIDAFVADWSAAGPRFQERVRRAREQEAKAAREDRRDPRPVRLGSSPKTISNAIVPLREMLGHAVEWEYLAANPAHGVKRPRADRSVKMHVLQLDEISKLLEKRRPRVGRCSSAP
jgi:integrase